ncbi:LysR family transcriptional regulator [Bordetella avium]|uniref:LysR-family transcriptional regulator n=1 Tax=Bordetella avium (strain 197N) TaxID=360910 RepID=Q2L1H3_BORA1|nr:LysR family transcriptional regulator [Bordetella avium]AZY49032.1 LysR family transcriptional regulator [Bordetella avium]AZY52389.1 LysR family transcriptional regulator [Bordetella avium]RIQ14271.1 LysR family transcriptional regulator [Bordetella avium]RIQ18148.1 LysR family transcriptional regulator [Bordetella avium]RIQ36618.1 LysR family transcriptional regulator [Bordetella avium]
MELFVEVAKTRNFSRAADNLGIPKSTLSRQVSELERAVGLQLLSRTTRKVELTAAGQLYFDRCQRIVTEAQAAHEELQKLLETPSGPLRVNLPADFGTEFMAESFVEFSRRYPEVDFYLDLASPEHAERVFRSCDVALQIGELPDSTQIARLLGMLPAGLYASPDYLDRHGRPLHPDDLAKHECLEFRVGHAGRVTRWPLTNGQQQFEITPGRRYSVNSVSMLRSLARLGAGIAILAARHCEDGESLEKVLPDWHAGPFPVYAVTDTRLLPAKTRIFIEFLMERLNQQGVGEKHSARLFPNLA